MELDSFLYQKYRKLMPLLDERSRRLVAAADCAALERGGISAVAEATGLSRPTLYKGMKELESGSAADGRSRRPGGGRKKVSEKFPGLEAALEALVEPTSRGDPMSPLRWTTKSVRKLASELKALGHTLIYQVVDEILGSATASKPTPRHLRRADSTRTAMRNLSTSTGAPRSFKPAANR